MSTSPLLNTLIPPLTPSLTPDKDNPFTSIGFIILMVVASLSAVLGAIYAFLYYTRINPRSNSARMFMQQLSSGDDGGNGSTHTHMLFNRKS